MKTMKFWALAGAVVLTSAVAFTSCKNKTEEEIDTTPEEQTGNNYNGEVAKTHFLVALSDNSVGNKPNRMLGTEVQQAQNRASFRGMDKIVLIPFQDAAITGTTTRLGSNITLPTLSDNAAENNSMPAGATTLHDVNNSYLYSNVQIPLGTKAFLFYGKAIDKAANTAITSDADMRKFGILTMNNESETLPNSISFSMKKINSNTENTVASNIEVGTTLIDYLTSIANTTDWATTDGMNDLRNKFCEITAGSSASVQALVQDLYTSLTPNKTALADAIRASILSATYGVTESAGVLTFPATLSGYPANIGLPDGAVAIAWNDSESKFESTTASVYNVQESPATTLKENYVYPASLYYRAQSTIVTSNTSQAANYVDGGDWATIKGNYTDATYVNAATRSVAIADQIQYAVGRLDVQVKASGKNLADQKGTNIPIVNGSANSFPITAVLIGGQKDVDFQFKPTGDNLYTIYDKNVPAPWAVTTAYGDANYTLVGETKEDTDVKIAIELQNNSGKDFYGLGGKLIPQGTKFYLIANLKVSSAYGSGEGSVTQPTGKTLNQVFLQDYVTTAKLNITKLSNAYNVVPDLTTESLELGFSVDLTWQTGITFEVNL